MDLRGFTDLGADIGKRVTDSINTGNFNQMNRDIRRIIEDAFTNPVKSSHGDILDGKLSRDEQQKSRGFDRVYTETAQAKHDDTVIKTPGGIPVEGNPPGRGGAVVMMIIGYMLTFVFGITGLGLALMMIPANTIEPASVSVFAASAVFMIPFFAGSLVLAIAGTRKYGMRSRFMKYLSVLQGSSFCQIRQLAARVGKKESFVIKELTKMIRKGYFPEGHIDDHRTCFIGDDATYRQYISARDSAADAASRNEKQEEVQDSIRQAVNEGNEYIRTIQKANDAIYDPVISEKLFRMEIIVKKIFEYVKENPDQLGQLRRFMSYYMPTTEKLVKAYQQMDEETVLGQNMTKAKTEIAETLDTINEAYEKLYDSMHIDIAMDVSSDIAVLKTMFAQEGLSKDKLGGKKDE